MTTYALKKPPTHTYSRYNIRRMFAHAVHLVGMVFSAGQSIIYRLV